MQSYSTPDEKGQNIKKISGILYRYYWKLGNSTKYGVYRNPKLIKNDYLIFILTLNPDRVANPVRV
jgi:hypothetical protein